MTDRIYNEIKAMTEKVINGEIIRAYEVVDLLKDTNVNIKWFCGLFEIKMRDIDYTSKLNGIGILNNTVYAMI